MADCSIPSTPFTITLGIHSTDSNSMTRILTLSSVGSASIGESPPMKMWINDSIQRVRIARIFQFSDTLQAGPLFLERPSCGSSFLTCMTEIMEFPSKQPQNRYSSCAVNVSRVQNNQIILQRSCRDKSFWIPTDIWLSCRNGTSSRLWHLHLSTFQFKYLPAITWRDEQRHTKARWNRNHYNELYKATEAPSNATVAATLVGNVCADIEKLGLCQHAKIQGQWDAVKWGGHPTPSKDKRQRQYIDSSPLSQLCQVDTEWRLCIILCIKNSPCRDAYQP